MIAVSAAVPGDVEAIAGLLAEMDRFYGSAGTEPLAERTRQISEALFGSPAAAQALLARDGGRVAGIAACSFLWPAIGLTRSLYLKELYVAEDYRRQGIGALLMSAVFEMAGEHGCSRVEWTTDTDNDGAQAFYERRLGIPVHQSKLFYRVEDTGTGINAPG